MKKILPWDCKKKANNNADKTYDREKSAGLYHTARWTRLSRAFRSVHPLCQACASKGIIKPAQVADHIIPWPVCGEDGFFSESNLQALCEDCNHIKGQHDKKLIAKWRREHADRRGRGV